jgi:hypothetical protein
VKDLGFLLDAQDFEAGKSCTIEAVVKSEEGVGFP